MQPRQHQWHPYRCLQPLAAFKCLATVFSYHHERLGLAAPLPGEDEWGKNLPGEDQWGKNLLGED